MHVNKGDHFNNNKHIYDYFTCVSIRLPAANYDYPRPRPHGLGFMQCKSGWVLQDSSRYATFSMAVIRA
jgi:hypothetical protein